MTQYARPLVQHGAARPENAVPLAGTDTLWFTHAELLHRSKSPRLIPAAELPAACLNRLTAPRAPVAGLEMTRPQIMAIVNVTPDSFSDGGVHLDPERAAKAAFAMTQAGASIIDIGGESTRPGAEIVSAEQETIRTQPVIQSLRQKSAIPISVDTRKAAVAAAAMDAGASLVNDVSGFTYDDELAGLCARAGVPVCVMHAQGDPATMQDDPRYDNVLLDVYDFLDERINALVTQGIARQNILVDPGIGFGKTLSHNLDLLKNISLFHGLGCVILLGVSRKRFIGTIGDAPVPADRAPGSIAVGLAALAQGVQILRVHDVSDTVQALRLWSAVR